MRIITETCRAY